MRLSNGPDKCAGQLEVKYSGSWRTISSTSWTKQNSDIVCQHLECGESMDSNQYHFVKSNLLILKWILKCSGRSILQCTMEKNENIQQNSAVNIICNSMGFNIFVFVYIWNVVHGSTLSRAVELHLQVA